MNKRIVFLSQLFDPEYSIKGFEFIQYLSRLGYDVQVVTANPSYPKGTCFEGYRNRLFSTETRDGVPITRLWTFITNKKGNFYRGLNYLSFFLMSTLYLLFCRKADLVYAYHPQVTTGLVGSIVKLFRRTPFITDIQDLWPESLIAEGLSEKSWTARIISKLVNSSVRNSKAVVVLSQGFKNNLIEKGIDSAKIYVVHNWCPEEKTYFAESKSVASESKNNLTTSTKTILYTGNHGPLQALETIIRAAAKFEDNCVRLILVGSGSEKPRLITLVDELNIRNVDFIDFTPPSQLRVLVEDADAVVCHLKDEPLFKITIPSKVQAYLCKGKPVLIATGGEANRLVMESGAGVEAEPENIDSIYNAIDRIINLPNERLEQMGLAGQVYYKRNLSSAVAMPRLVEVIESCL